MHTDTQQLWLAWGRGELDDASAQAGAEQLAREAAHTAKRRREAAIERDRWAAEQRVERAADAAEQAEQSQAAGRPQNAPTTAPRPPRAKAFGDGRLVPLDRNAKVRVMMLARALMRRSEKGKHYGLVTSKFVDVLRALLWGFHNASSGKCFPSYESIADRADCSRTTVYSAIRTLEQLGILTWVNRIKRVREWVPGLFGKTSAWRWSVQRTSNAYAFNDPSSKFKFQTETPAQGSTEERFASFVPRRAASALPMVVRAKPFSTAGT